jgi:hypothetical protein
VQATQMPKRREELARSVLPDRARTARAGSPRPRDRASLRGPGHRGNARGRPRRTAGRSPRAAAPPARTASARLAVRSASRARCARLRAPGERRAGTDRRGRPGRAAPRRPRLRGPSANESVFGGGTPVGAPVAPAALLPRHVIPSGQLVGGPAEQIVRVAGTLGALTGIVGCARHGVWSGSRRIGRRLLCGVSEQRDTLPTAAAMKIGDFVARDPPEPPPCALRVDGATVLGGGPSLHQRRLDHILDIGGRDPLTEAPDQRRAQRWIGQIDRKSRSDHASTGRRAGRSRRRLRF